MFTFDIFEILLLMGSVSRVIHFSLQLDVTLIIVSGKIIVTTKYTAKRLENNHLYLKNNASKRKEQIEAKEKYT